MGREQRRRDQRQQRRGPGRPAQAPSPLVGPATAMDPEVVRAAPANLGQVRPSASPRRPASVPTTPSPRVATVPAPPETPAVPVPEEQTHAPSSQAPSSPAPAATEPAPAVTAASLSTISVGCGVVADVEPQALGLTYTFDARPDGEPYPMAIRFVGRRTGVTGERGPGDAFDVVANVDRVVPGSGRITLSKRVGGITAGTWEAAAAPVPVAGSSGAVQPGFTSTSGPTGWAPAVQVIAPGVRLGAWPGLVVLGAVVAVALLLALVARAGLPVGPVLVLAAIACLVGVVGAKVYYLVEHPGQRLKATGMCIQGFVLAAVGTVVVGALVLAFPIGTLLDAAAPGLMFGQAIGRTGCFLGGCCVGRPVRRGLWSSDRRVGMRRIPTQLFESAGALLIGGVALLAVLASTSPGGVVFVGTIAAYTLLRQFLFPLRDLPRNTSWGRTATAVASGLVLVGAITVAAVA